MWPAFYFSWTARARIRRGSRCYRPPVWFLILMNWCSALEGESRPRLSPVRSSSHGRDCRLREHALVRVKAQTWPTRKPEPASTAVLVFLLCRGKCSQLSQPGEREQPSARLPANQLRGSEVLQATSHPSPVWSTLITASNNLTSVPPQRCRLKPWWLMLW